MMWNYFPKVFFFLVPYTESFYIVLIVRLITYFMIVIGELIPQTIILRNADVQRIDKMIVEDQ
ncbi:hypothetical protein [Catalinimonas niigatensis]|uniref:hypothetical protein n=1 Tax=Catalinimonas niigatensis TaxID=1397264 RepID=UPI0026650DF5|nr:hypothetical protein [Catalinimonas niigatensis]WPP52427.1 hypothetical protein PZB72_08530 [Catalinimonas niigatensis]